MKHLAVILVSLFLPVLAMADYGTGALRFVCDYKTKTVEVEPFVAWNDDNSRYPFSVEEALEQGFKHVSETLHFSAYAYKDRMFIYEECHLVGRLVRVFITREHLTIIDNGELVVDWVEIGNAWSVDTTLIARSSSPGKWELCSGIDSENVTCKRPHDDQEKH